MIICHLTKLESALDQLRKAYPKLNPADAAMIASALAITGRHAVAIYNDTRYTWPFDNEKLTLALSTELQQTSEGIETTVKKPTKAAAAAPIAEEDMVFVTVGLAPNIPAGEKLLLDREDLKTLLSDVIQAGVEYHYSPTDLGWQWALDRANWSTVSGGELNRRIKVKAHFTEGAVGVEIGTGAPKKRSSKAAKTVEVVEAVEPDSEALATTEVEEI